MKIDPRIFDGTSTIPTVGSLQGGETFIYNNDLYMKVADTSHHGFQAINLADGEIVRDDDILDDAGVTVVKICATRYS